MNSILAHIAFAVFGTAEIVFWGTVTRQTFCTETDSAKWWLSGYSGAITVIVTMITAFILNSIGGGA